MRIEVGFYHNASAPRQPHLKRPASRCGSLFRYSGNFHRNKLRCSRFANTLLPVVKLPITKPAITTERRNSLTARNLFGNQPSPLRPLFRSPALHPSTLRHNAAIYKMGFT
jgi:hypothetical protein